MDRRSMNGDAPGTALSHGLHSGGPYIAPEDLQQMEQTDAPEGKPFFAEEVDSSELVFLNLLGTGSQGEVYKCLWWRQFPICTSCITVAVKKLRNNSGPLNQDTETRTYNISHPNLVKCLDATTFPPYLIVSEFCSGGTLYDLIHDPLNQLTWRQRIKILLDIAQGMEYLHSFVPMVLHRDLKSTNVLLAKRITSPSQRPVAKVADFGLSRTLNVSSAAQMTCGVGTWRWMAPEVLRESSYDERVDVFSFGITMFEVLAQKVPYEDKWPMSTHADARIGLAIERGHRPDVRLVQGGCPNELVELMQACWAAEPSERPDFKVLCAKLEDTLNRLRRASEDGPW